MKLRNDYVALSIQVLLKYMAVKMTTAIRTIMMIKKSYARCFGLETEGKGPGF